MIKLLNSCIYYMGCISEGGCLGPKRRQRDVYAQLVDSIHEQARKIQFTEYLFPDNINIYSAIRQKLVKKGYLRKLLDNLTSHKANINECLSHNLRLTTQSQHIQNKYAGLIVLNQITNSLYQQKKSSQIYQEKTIIKTSSSQGKMIPTQENQKDRYTTVAIDLRAETQFFRLVTHLLENEGRMYSKTLESIIKFCDGRKESFGCRSQVWRVLQLLLKKIQRGILVDQSARAYLALIEQLRESNQDEIDYQDVLLAFLRLWLVKQSEEVYEGAEVNLEIKYEQILKVLVRRSISSSKPTVIYRSLFSIYQSQGFSGTKMLACEQLLITIIKQNDLHSPVIRGLFVYMLQYLSNTSVRERSNSWRSSMGDQFHMGRYPKIMDKKGRLHAFQTLRRWAEKGYFNIQEYINFGSSALVEAFTANLSIQKQFGKQVIRQFLKLTQPLKSSTTLILVSLLMQDIKYQSSNDGLRLMLITLVREVVGQRKLLQQSDDNFPYFIPLDATFVRDTRLELIQLMGFITKRIPKSQFEVQQNISSQFSHNLCEFFHSIYEGLLSPGKEPRLGKKPQDDQILFRYQFANSALSFMKCLCEKGSLPYILSFITALISSLPETVGQQKLSIYFLLYVIYEGMHLLNSKQKLPDKMVALNFKLAPSVKASQIKGEIEGVVDYLMGSRGQNVERLVATFRANVQSLREFTMITQKIFNQVNVSFSDYFKENKHKGSFYLQTSKNQFKRNSMNGSCNESSGERSRLEQDESFKDVMDKIINI